MVYDEITDQILMHECRIESKGTKQTSIV